MDSISSTSRDLAELVSRTEMLSILECPVCFEVPFPPIFMCMKGHNICKNCKPKLNGCPQCKAELSEIRNFTVEKIILTSSHACHYKKDGCDVLQKGDLIEKHLKICKYRPGKCPYFRIDGCNETCLKLSEVHQHLVSVHLRSLNARTRPNMLKVNGSRQCSTMIDYNFEYRGVTANARNYGGAILELDGKRFIVDLVSKDSMFFWTILLIGTEEEAKIYNGKIVVQSAKDLKISWNIPINSIVDRTVRSMAIEEPEIFIPSCSWKDLKLLCVTDKENSERIKFCTVFTISNKVWRPSTNIKTTVSPLSSANPFDALFPKQPLSTNYIVHFGS